VENFYDFDFKAVEFDGFKIEFLNEGFFKRERIEKINKIVIN